MFYFDNIENKKILKSDFIKSAQAFFTTKESVITPNVLSELEDLCQQNKDQIAKYLGINERNFVIPKQTHSDNIKIADINENFEDTDAQYDEIIERFAFEEVANDPTIQLNGDDRYLAI